jgi:hypothetical protein
MIRTILSSIMAIHGIIHLMGFAKEWKLGPVGRFSGKTMLHVSDNATRAIGTLWFMACVLLLISTLAYYSRKDWFWIIGVAALLVSQTLIIIYWRDAKWATVFNIVLFGMIVFAAGRVSFDKMVKEDVQNLQSVTSGDRSVITAQEVSLLPDLIQTWLLKSDVVGKPMPGGIHIMQKGSLRMDANSVWHSFDAEQYFTIDPPGFVWKATIHTDKLIDIVGRDKYICGQGNMLIKAGSLITIANSTGKEVDQGTLVRYMAEIIWFPHAAVSDYLDWEKIDDNHARVTMNYNDVIASGIYAFNEEGLPVAFEAERFGKFNNQYSKEIWSVKITHYAKFDGIPIANKSEVTWKLKEGNFTWLKVEVTAIEYQ